MILRKQKEPNDSSALFKHVLASLADDFDLFSTKILKFSQPTSSSKSFVFDLAMTARSRVLSWSRVVLVDWGTTRLNISFLLVDWFKVVSCTGRLISVSSEENLVDCAHADPSREASSDSVTFFLEHMVFSRYGLYLDVDKTLSALGRWQSFWECNFVVCMLTNAGNN